ncbi:hypothetical protein CJ030_MR6G029209 [Morella rubra]|uniref:Protein JASON n=1 Tax=Morella rubra TaxID=262757 RepID=A0A6A1VBU9_9ROSI|nr:hypothetical protein CJ030_MR6G029209 [Morella rubra]
MRWSSLKRDLGFLCRSSLRFLDRSVSRAMGCFFACFRIRDDGRRPPSHFVSGSATASKPTNEDSPCNDKQTPNLGSPQRHKGLNDEAKFLKACGTLVETPSEIRKATEKLKSSPPYDGDSGPRKFHSWLPNTSIKKLQLENQLDQPPTPVKLCGEWGKGSVSQERTPSSCISSIENTGRTSFSSIEGSGTGCYSTGLRVHGNETENILTSDSPLVSATDVKFRNKSVRFDCDLNVSCSRSSPENVSQNPQKYEATGDRSVSKPSPYPTPLKLSDEMQTPGTVFPTNLENLPHGITRIRSQYVNSVLNPVDSDSQWNVLKEEDSNSHQLSSELRESLDFAETATPSSEGGIKEILPGKEMKVEASLSAWLKPQPGIQDVNTKNYDLVSTQEARFGRIPGDRPIIGIVAAHWNYDEPSHISPKWWDGNGIPNSTNKYKEDQKVSWHATPFEERLEKALSEESSISQGKDIYGKPIAFDDDERGDTALSQLQSSSHPNKSLVSF